MSGLVNDLKQWPARRWWFAAGTAIATYLFIAIPTDLIDNPVFGRDVPPTPWSRTALAISSVLAGLVAATYVATPDSAPRAREGRLGAAGGMVTFFAVGCPVCNKLVLLALGTRAPSGSSVRCSPISRSARSPCWPGPSSEGCDGRSRAGFQGLPRPPHSPPPR